MDVSANHCLASDADELAARRPVCGYFMPSEDESATGCLRCGLAHSLHRSLVARVNPPPHSDLPARVRAIAPELQEQVRRHIALLEAGPVDREALGREAVWASHKSGTVAGYDMEEWGDLEQVAREAARAAGEHLYRLGQADGDDAVAIDHYRDGLSRIMHGETDPVSIAASYLGEDMPNHAPPEHEALTLFKALPEAERDAVLELLRVRMRSAR